jgi:hypothetical protein
MLTACGRLLLPPVFLVMACRGERAALPPPPTSTGPASTPPLAEAGPDEQRLVAQVRLAPGRLLSVLCSRHAFTLVERDQEVVRTEEFQAYGWCDDAQARFVDLDGDGLLDVVFQTPWQSTGDPSIEQPGPSAELSHFSIAVRRTGSVDAPPSRDRLGAELDMLGARDIDEAVGLARRPRSPVAPIDPHEACAVLRRASTVSGFRAAATETARLVDFADPESPAAATRIVRAPQLRDEDVRALRDECKPSQFPFRCEGAVCSRFDTPLANLFRFVRVGGVLELDLALIYVGT